MLLVVVSWVLVSVGGFRHAFAAFFFFVFSDAFVDHVEAFPDALERRERGGKSDEVSLEYSLWRSESDTFEETEQRVVVVLRPRNLSLLPPSFSPVRSPPPLPQTERSRLPSFLLLPVSPFPPLAGLGRGGTRVCRGRRFGRCCRRRACGLWCL